MQYSLTVYSLIPHITAKFLIPSPLFDLILQQIQQNSRHSPTSPRELRKIRTF